jgi:hypothetical protein
VVKNFSRLKRRERREERGGKERRREVHVANF